MEVINSISVYMDSKRIIPPINAVQGETGRHVKVFLMTDEGPWAIPNDASVLVRFRKPDGTSGVYNAMPDGSKAWSITDSAITIQLAPQMLTVAGTTLVQVAIVSDGTTVSTFAVSLCVQADVSAAVVASEDYVNLIPHVEECEVTVTLRNYFGSRDGGVCYTFVRSDGEITSLDGPVASVAAGVNEGTFRCVKGSILIARKGNMPATTYTATTTGAITNLSSNSTTDHTCMMFKVDGDGTITIE